MSDSLRLPGYETPLDSLSHLVVVPVRNGLAWYPSSCLIQRGLVVFFFLQWVLGKVMFEYALLHSGKTCSPLHNCSVMGKLCEVGVIMLTGRMFRPHSLSSMCDSILERGILLWNSDNAYLSFMEIKGGAAKKLLFCLSLEHYLRSKPHQLAT